MASIVLAGGGTAGHIEPALAVARVWQAQNPGDSITFLGTATGLENEIIPAAGFDLSNIPKVSISRKPSLSWIRIPFDLFASIKSCHSILKTADVLIGFGGYVSAPAYVAARIAGVPTVIHEANAKPGWANRLGALMTSYLAVANVVPSGIFTDALITGLPLRSDVAAALKSSERNWEKSRIEAKLRLGCDPKKPLLFIMGGSQGSVALNEVVTQALPIFSEKNIYVIHSVGRRNELPPPGDAYRPLHYVDTMADMYLASDLIVARSGAVTCSEFRALGRYAVFVPLPIGNGEQFENARGLVEDGRAVIVSQKDFTFDFLLANIDSLLNSSKQAAIEGSTVDADAAVKICALAHYALEKR